MGSFLWERMVRVPPAKARAWWFDLQEDDHHSEHHRKMHRKPPTRRVLSRTADTVVVEDDFGNGPAMRATLRLVGDDRLETRYESAMYASEGLVTFLPEEGGTRIRLAFSNEWKGAGKLLGLFMQKPMESFIRRDLDAHARDLEDDWARAPW